MAASDRLNKEEFTPKLKGTLTTKGKLKGSLAKVKTQERHTHNYETDYDKPDYTCTICGEKL